MIWASKNDYSFQSSLHIWAVQFEANISAIEYVYIKIVPSQSVTLSISDSHQKMIKY